MESLIQVFRMNEISVVTRIKILKRLGVSINNQMAMNITQALVYELVLALDPKNEIANDESYTMFLDR